MRIPRLLFVAATVSLIGCDRSFFHATGAVSSDGGHIGVWSSTPQGCTRDPFDGLPPAQSSSVLALLWNDPVVRHPLPDPHRSTGPDAPLRLEIARASGGGYFLKLDTVMTADATLDRSDCATLDVQTQETPRTLPEGKPTLSGSLQLDCRVSGRDGSGSHITANLRFNRCEY